jgi:hypothetical protein
MTASAGMASFNCIPFPTSVPDTHPLGQLRCGLFFFNVVSVGGGEQIVDAVQTWLV